MTQLLIEANVEQMELSLLFILYMKNEWKVRLFN